MSTHQHPLTLRVENEAYARFNKRSVYLRNTIWRKRSGQLRDNKSFQCWKERKVGRVGNGNVAELFVVEAKGLELPTCLANHAKFTRSSRQSEVEVKNGELFEPIQQLEKIAVGERRRGAGLRYGQ